MKRLVSLLTLCATLAFLTSCFSDDQAPTQTTSTATQSTVEDPPLQLQPVILEVRPDLATGNFSVTRQVNLPPGFGIQVFAANLSHVRQMALSPDGIVYATVRAEGRVVRLPDADGDGVADRVETVADGLQGVHGIEFHDGLLYVATEVEVIRLEDADGDGVMEKRALIIGDMPTGGTGRAGANHSTRTIRFGPDDKLYVSIGSSCNACVEEDERRAAITRYSLDGTREKVYARGLRNSVGIRFHPETGELWAVNNGRDFLGEDTPPEGVYRVQEDANYGWPYCYPGAGKMVDDPEIKPEPGYCEKTSLPAFTLPAHYAPLGLAFYSGASYPPQYNGDMFITSHGSWDRKVRHGYKVLRARFHDNQPDTSQGDLMLEDFATGWLLDPISGAHWGRPVDLLVAPDGSLFLTDDAAMAVYRIYYRGTVGVGLPGMPACQAVSSTR